MRRGSVAARRHVRGAIAIAIALAAPAPAAAQDRSDRVATAQALYERAAELIRAGQWAEACPKLEESQRLDPAMGTQFYLASCHESTGRITSAWSLFLEVAAAAKAAGNTARERTARARAADLEPRLPRLTVIVPDEVAAVAGLEVIRDGAAQKPVVWGTPVPVEVGAHLIRVTAPAKQAWERRVVLAERAREVVTVPVLADATGAPPSPVVTPPVVTPPVITPPVVPPPPRSTRLSTPRVLALTAFGVGVAGVVTGSVLGVMAGSTWSGVDAACPKHTGCSKQAHDDSKRALSLATGSTIAFIGGGVALGTAVALWLIPGPRPTSALHLTPVAGSGVTGLIAGGSW